MIRARRLRLGLLQRGGAYGYQTAIIRGAHEQCEEEGADLLCFAGGMLTTHDPRNFVYQLADFAELDAVILVPSTMGDAAGGPEFRRLVDRFREIPMCTIGNKHDGVPAVRVDNATGVHDLTCHLVEQHHRRRIAFIGAFSFEARQRQNGYLAALAASGIEPDENLIFPGDFTPDAGKHAVSLMAQGGRLACDAIVAANDWTAIGALEELERRGYRVPDDVSVVGFDDIEKARFLTPPLTTISQPPKELGKQAVKLLLHMLDGDKSPADVFISTEARVRQSCGCFSAPTSIVPQSVRPANSRAELVLNHRPRWIVAVQAAGCSTTPALQDQWPALLVDAFISNLADKRRGAFLHALGDVITRSAHLGNITSWHAAVGALRKASVADLMVTPEQWVLAESIFEQAHILVGDQAERVQARRRLDKEALLRDLEEMSAQVRTSLDDLSLQHAVVSHLPRFKIPSCFVAAKSEHEGGNSRIILAYDRQRGLNVNQNDQRFRRELVPACVLPEWRHSLMIQPLFFDDEPLGYVSLELGPEDGTVYEFIAEILSTAVKAGKLTRAIADEVTKRERAERARLAQELEIAARIQTGILPKHTRVSGLEIASTMLPTDEVGGDYFDVIPVERGCWLAIGDVAGHGLKTGLVMLMIQSIIAATTHADPTARPAKVWQALNHVLCDNVRSRLGQDEHATLSLLRYDSGGNVVVAGAHEDIVVYRARVGRCEVIPTQGVWAGITQDLPPDPNPESEFELEPGDLLVLYTDGIVEAMSASGDQFGLDRLCRLVEKVCMLPVSDICEQINRSVLAHMHEQKDDLTLLITRYVGRE